MSNVVIGLPLTTIAATGDLIYMDHAGQDTAINVGNLFAYELDNSLVVTPAQVVARPAHHMINTPQQAPQRNFHE